jgi:hypothetical protein
MDCWQAIAWWNASVSEATIGKKGSCRKLVQFSLDRRIEWIDGLTEKTESID